MLGSKVREAVGLAGFREDFDAEGSGEGFEHWSQRICLMRKMPLAAERRWSLRAGVQLVSEGWRRPVAGRGGCEQSVPRCSLWASLGRAVWGEQE